MHTNNTHTYVHIYTTHTHIHDVHHCGMLINATHTPGCECFSGGLLGFFNLATAATCELMAFMNPELSVIPATNYMTTI